MYKPRYLLILSCASAVLTAQTQIDLLTQSKRVDFTTATFTKPVKTGTALPATCLKGEMFLHLNSQPGSNVYACISPNTWILQGGGSGRLTVQNSGVVVGSETTANFVPGTGLIYAISDVNSILNIQHIVDTATVETHSSHQAGSTLLCASVTVASNSHSCLMVPTLGAYVRGMIVHWIPDSTTPGGRSCSTSILWVRKPSH